MVFLLLTCRATDYEGNWLIDCSCAPSKVLINTKKLFSFPLWSSGGSFTSYIETYVNVYCISWMQSLCLSIHLCFQKLTAKCVAWLSVIYQIRKCWVVSLVLNFSAVLYVSWDNSCHCIITADFYCIVYWWWDTWITRKPCCLFYHIW